MKYFRSHLVEEPFFFVSHPSTREVGSRNAGLAAPQPACEVGGAVTVLLVARVCGFGESEEEDVTTPRRLAKMEGFLVLR